MSLHLSPRQEAVCYFVLRGESDKAIARLLGIGIRTVHTHVQDAADRIRAHCRGTAPDLARETLPRKVIRRYYVETSIVPQAPPLQRAA